MIIESKELKVIKDFYKEATAKRSGLPLMNHIHEGIMILKALDASDLAIKAFCIHPIVQNNIKIDLSWSSALLLAQEYSKKANSYLCRSENDWIRTVKDLDKVVGNMSEDCRLMLLADKYQNQKDFRIHHLPSHKRSEHLERYFNLWIDYLKSLREVPV